MAFLLLYSTNHIFCRSCIVIAFIPLQGFKSKRNHFSDKDKNGMYPAVFEYLEA